MDITPSPRILRMLGEIEFPEWQCIAELIDNAFDEFTEIQRSGSAWPGGFVVSVTLPGKGKLESAEIVVRDTGRGMSRSALEKAVRAGWSSNDRLDKLGLFGMGFNVSTARLGTSTQVLTTRVGDLEWTGVEIDFDELSDDFQAADASSIKGDLNDHGTSITISRLKRQHAEWFQRNAEQLRQVLGGVYSYILSSSPIELWVGGVRVKPRLHCVWGEDRYVVYGAGSSAEQIPAVIKIDETFAPADACGQCGNWQELGFDVCRECGSDEITARARRVHGWVGIQRHLDKRDFGIDFLRNGRKILRYDKRVFDWDNPNNPVSGTAIEYPVELVNSGGRIVGEIHLDHVPVTYSKNAFDYSDRGWRAAMDIIRGEGPLLPASAERLGYAKNSSPIAKLIEGYRRIDAGRRNLVPGNGTGPIHETTRDWAKKFWAGDPDYQSDLKWWEAVESHELRKNSNKVTRATEGSPNDADEDAVLQALGVPTDPSQVLSTDLDRGKAVIAETVQERIDRLTISSAPLPELTRSFGLPDLGVVEVEAFIVPDAELLDDLGHVTPVWLKVGSGRTAKAFINSKHEVFERFGSTYADALLAELGPLMKVRSSSALAYSQIASELRAACLPDTAVDFATIHELAADLLLEIRLRMSENIAVDPQRAIQHLDPYERTVVEAGVVSEGGIFSSDIWTDGSFLLYAPPLYLAKLLDSWPEAFLDGRVFRGPYSTLNSPSAMRMSVTRVVSYLNDVANLLTSQTRPPVAQLQRTRWSCSLLADELVE